MVMNCLNFYLFGKVSCLHFWRTALLCEVYLVGSLSFSTLNISFHLLLACKVSAKASADSPPMRAIFFSWHFKNLALSLILEFHYYFREFRFGLKFMGDLLTSWTGCTNLFPSLGSFLPLFLLSFLRLSPSSPSGTSMVYRLS